MRGCYAQTVTGATLVSQESGSPKPLASRAHPNIARLTRSTRGHAGEAPAWVGATAWPAAPTSAVKLEAPPADELELVVFVMAARGTGAGRIDIAEVGFREVPAEGEREGAGRPPETDLGLPVVDAEEVRSGRIGDKTAGHDRPIVVERCLKASRPAKAERVGEEEDRVDPGADALSRRKSAVLVEDHAAVEVRVGDPTLAARPHGPTLQLERHGPALLVEADSVQDQRAVGDLIGEVAVLEVHLSIEVRRRGATIEPFPSLAPGHARVKRRRPDQPQSSRLEPDPAAECGEPAQVARAEVSRCNVPAAERLVVD